MTHHATPTELLGLAGATSSAARPSVYAGAGVVALAGGHGRDWRLAPDADSGGTIVATNRVMVKADASAPELPYAGARVRLHRLVDGYCAWEGTSDAAGWYWPRGLEVGVAYYPVAIDPTGQHECDAAGPVIATLQEAP